MKKIGPKKCKIGAYDVQIKYVPKPKSGGVTIYGSCNMYTNKIVIDDDLNPKQKFSTLIHEGIEGIKANCDLKISHQTLQTLEAELVPFLLSIGVKNPFEDG